MNLLRAAAVAKKLDMHRATVFRLARRDDSFPKPIKLSARYTAWVEEEIDKWLLTCKLNRSDLEHENG